MLRLVGMWEGHKKSSRSRKKHTRVSPKAHLAGTLPGAAEGLPSVPFFICKQVGLQGNSVHLIDAVSWGYDSFRLSWGEIPEEINTAAQASHTHTHTHTQTTAALEMTTQTPYNSNGLIFKHSYHMIIPTVVWFPSNNSFGRLNIYSNKPAAYAQKELPPHL